MDSMNTEELEHDIAVVGMACRFPGAKNAEEFWQNVRDNKEAVQDLTDEQLIKAGVKESLLSNPLYVKRAAVLDNMDKFDPGLFGLSSLDAKMMDPQHRHFLELSWEALEHSGYDPSQYKGAIGVFGGSGHNAYMPYNLFSNPEFMAQHGLFLVRHTGNDKDFLCTRVSYHLDLQGPSVNVQTACSTSLVAIHYATQSLLSHECDMALAGGVTIENPHGQGYLYKEGEILSPDGHCRPFDVNSQGTLFGSGAGIVVLKRLVDAIEARDTIHAVIKSSAINNDGSGKVSYMAPSVEGQAAAIHEALAVADIPPQTVQFIECHGTGTPLGDPIEVAALTHAYGKDNDEQQYCALGSVKANIGHLDTAAGVAGFIKAIMALKAEEIPPTTNFTADNPQIDFANSPFFVNAGLKPWPATSEPKRAAVSSLGVGGTNAHIILEETLDEFSQAKSQQEQRHELLAFSGNTPEALERNINQLVDFLHENPETSFEDLAYTLKLGRKPLKHRYVTSSDSVANFLKDMAEPVKPESFVKASEHERKVTFMFPGGGAQYPNMGRNLYEKEPVYREAIDECLNHLKTIVDYDLKALLYPEPQDFGAAKSALEKPSRSVMSLLVTQYAQAKLWMSWGIQPDSFVGHSLGENTAACLSGVFSLKDILGLVALRGQIFESADEGGMLSVQLSAEAVEPLLGDNLTFAALNAAELCVVTGPIAALEELQETLSNRDIESQRVKINVAAHSALLDPVLSPFRSYLESIQLNSPEVPFLSNLTGGWIGEQQAASSEYWVEHLRNTVKFSECVNTLLQDKDRILLEVGPGETLCRLTKMQSEFSTEHVVLNSMRRADETDINDCTHMKKALGQLWIQGAVADWTEYNSGRELNRIPLPTYSFDHRTYWVEPGDAAFKGGEDDESNFGFKQAREEDQDNWLYHGVWRRQALAPRAVEESSSQTVLLFDDQSDLSTKLVSALDQNQVNSVRIVPGSQYQKVDANQFTVNPGNADDYLRLITELQTQEIEIAGVIHTWSRCVKSDGADNWAASRAFLFDSLFHLSQIMAMEALDNDQRWLVITEKNQAIGSDEISNPLSAIATGPAKVIPNEFPNVKLSYVDIDSANSDRACNQLVSEWNSLKQSDSVAYRGHQRWTLQYEVAPSTGYFDKSNQSEPALPTLKAGGSYLITGGLGGLGLKTAATLAKAESIHLILVTRRDFPARDQWETLIEQSSYESDLLQELIAIEKLDATVQIESVDITDAEALKSLKATIDQQHGGLNGIIHTAGVIDDELISVKEIEKVDKVLAPKVQGTLNLDNVFQFSSLDFSILFSSTSAVLGLPGQVDYASANAFLDAYALYHHGLGNSQVLAINWPAWRDAGMAANIANGKHVVKQKAGALIEHPLLDRLVEKNQNTHVYSTLYSVERNWIIKEHRIKDSTCLIPGSGYIEIARAAFSDAKEHNGPISIRDVSFQLPFVVHDGEVNELQVHLQWSDENTATFIIQSENEDEWQEHCRGIVAMGNALSGKEDISSLQGRCQQGKQTFDDPDHHPLLDFGPRWASLEAVGYGDSEACIELKLDDEFSSDLDHHHLHPAMLDMATAGAQKLIPHYHPNTELYVPVRYGELNYSSALPQHFFSHVRYRGSSGNDAVQDALFDITLMDANGNVLTTVESFTLQLISDVELLKRELAKHDVGNHENLEQNLALGIDSAEGMALLSQAITQASPPNSSVPQVLVSPYPFSELEAVLLPQDTAADSFEEEDSHDPDADPIIPEIRKIFEDHEALETVIVRSYLVDDEPRYAAYYKTDGWETVTVSDLRRFAKKHLPADQVPQHFVELDEVPKNDQGEIDPTSLSNPFAPKDHYIPPKTSTEKTLARIWQEVLGVERISLTDNFLDAGGHSLLSIRVIAKVNKKLGVKLDQAQMALSTLEQLASEIDQTNGTTAQSAQADEPAQKDTQSQSTDTEKAPGKSGFLKNLFGKRA